jgi:UDP-GlcNAc:undecaprenyl-phosphate GlcNAc-1-phosphate transferase
VGDRVAFVIALALGLSLTPVVRAAGAAIGLVDRPQSDTDPRTLKIHARPVPTVGGIAVVCSAFGAAVLSGAHLEAWVVLAAAIALVVGQIDDIRPLRPTIRIVAGVVAGGALSLGAPAIPQFAAASSFVVVLLALGCANAVNLIDGQDGLAGGVAAVSALGLAGVAAAGADASSAVLIALALAGALLAFLAWNRPPAAVFLGNGGAFAVGVVLAFLAASGSSAGWPATLATVVCLLPLAFEVAFTATRRLVSNAPLATGDRSHSYDRLRRALGSVGLSTLACCAIAFACGGVAIVVAGLSVPAGIVLVGASAAPFLGVGAWLLHADRAAARA